MQRYIAQWGIKDLPDSFRGLPQPVKSLYVLGDFKELCSQPCVAIVGSRKVSPYGRSVTHMLAGELARAGVVIVSGLALGVDAIAHQAALEVGGRTIAVLPSDLDHIYPASNRGLADRIVVQGGALVSEYPPGSSNPQKYQFIARNRIITALSCAVVIPEAAHKSGSLHTANFALEQGKEVFAVPGSILSAMSSGTNRLIKDGAGCVTSARDILEVLGIENQPLMRDTRNLSLSQSLIIQALKEGSSTITQLATTTRLSISEIMQSLTHLEIIDLVYNNGSEWFVQA